MAFVLRLPEVATQQQPLAPSIVAISQELNLASVKAVKQ